MLKESTNVIPVKSYSGFNMRANLKSMPIVVGGIGGSRSRVAAQMLKPTVIFMGDNFNGREDNMTCLTFSRHEKQNQGSRTDRKTDSSRGCQKNLCFYCLNS